MSVGVYELIEKTCDSHRPSFDYLKKRFEKKLYGPVGSQDQRSGCGRKEQLRKL